MRGIGHVHQAGKLELCGGVLAISEPQECCSNMATQQHLPSTLLCILAACLPSSEVTRYYPVFAAKRGAYMCWSFSIALTEIGHEFYIENQCTLYGVL